MTKPITPGEIKKKSRFPDEVIAAFNELIEQDFDGREATVRQNVVVALVLTKLAERQAREPGFEVPTADQMFERHWFDIESLFEDWGWRVEYDKPAYNEDYEPTWTFKKKRVTSKGRRR